MQVFQKHQKTQNFTKFEIKQLLITFAKKYIYAVLFDLDMNCLNECYDGATYHGAYKLIRDFMTENGFAHTQGSVYFGDSNMDAVKCVITVQKLSKKYSWFATCVKDVRMLRIEENNDLSPAIRGI